MSVMGYTKLFSELIMSTVWRESDHVRILWITLLALKDRYHKVNASLPGLADAAKITMTECEEALKILSSPDPYSRTKDFEGRRIEKCDGGWLVLNGEKYRQKLSAADRREYQRVKQAEYREKRKQERLQKSSSGQRFTHTEADTDTKSDTKEGKRERPRSKKKFSKPSPEAVAGYMQERGMTVTEAAAEAYRFHDHYESNGWRVGKGNPMKDWQAAVRNWMRRKGEFGKGGKQDDDFNWNKTVEI